MGAFFCDDFIEDQRGGWTATRIRHNATYTLPDDTGMMERLVVILVAGPGSPSARVRVVAHKPNGYSEDLPDVVHRFSGTGIGHNIIVDVPIPAEEGTYWFDVYVNGVFAVSTPYNVTRLIPSGDSVRE